MVKKEESAIEHFPDLNIEPRLLLGPGPSNINPRVLRAMAVPVTGYLDSDYLALMDRLQALLRMVFRTENPATLVISGTGSAGMEAALANLLEAGDEMIVGAAGLFGERLAEIGSRYGAVVHRVVAEWGEAIAPERFEAALARCRRPKLVALVQAETSTGVHQPVAEIAELSHRYGAFTVLDAVTALGCVPVEVDRWGIDVCYSCSQKGLAAPPGLAPITFSERATEFIKRRQSKCSSWYLDLGLLERYWSPERVYHHTPPIVMHYALYEALRVVLEEGLENRWRRHELASSALCAGLKAAGLKLAAQEGFRLAPLTTVFVPEGIDEAEVRQRLLKRFRIEIGAGFGPLKGRIWRIGLMGENARRESVVRLLEALVPILRELGYANADLKNVLDAVEEVYRAEK